MLESLSERLTKLTARMTKFELGLRRHEDAQETTSRMHHAAIVRLTEQVFPGHTWPPREP